MAKCRICGEPHKACGPASTVIPVDERVTEGRQEVALERYEVTVEGRHPHTATLMLSAEEAERLGVKPKTETKARTPRNKAAKPAANK